MTHSLLVSLTTALAGVSLTAQVPKAVTAERAGWHLDLDAAKVEAERDGKDLLLAFVCSDDGKASAKLGIEVFDAQAFQKFATKHLVLVELDFPKHPNQNEELRDANRSTGLEYNVATQPVLLLTDAAGRPYLRIDSHRDSNKAGVKTYIRRFEKGRKLLAARDEQFAKASELEATERARALHTALQLLDARLLEFYEDELEEIVLLDKDNAARLKNKVQPVLQQCRRDRDHRMIFANIADGALPPQQAERYLMEFLETHSKQLQGWEPIGEVYNTLGMVLAHQKRWNDAIDWVKKAKSVEPSEAKFFDRIIKDYERQRDAGGK